MAYIELYFRRPERGNIVQSNPKDRFAPLSLFSWPRHPHTWQFELGNFQYRLISKLSNVSELRNENVVTAWLVWTCDGVILSWSFPRSPHVHRSMPDV